VDHQDRTPAHRSEDSYLTALSPDGARLYRVGFSATGGYTEVGQAYVEVGDVTTTALDARTGQRLWSARAGDTDPGGLAFPRGVAVLAGGDRIVTGGVVGVVRSDPGASAFRLRPVLLAYDR
jgi:outer membrane protein assembly factor BamB